MRNLIFLSTTLLTIVFTACRSRQADNEYFLTEKDILAFADTLENTIMEEQAYFLDEAVLRDSILKKAKENPLFASIIDAEAATAFFNRALNLGNFLIREMKNGGDYKFIDYYVKQNEYHLIFRTYYDFTLKIDDYTIINTEDGIKIKDIFFYNAGLDLATYTALDVVYHFERQRNPQDENLSVDFLTYIDSLKSQTDERFMLLNQFLLYFNKTNQDGMAETAEKLEKYTGKDAIYRFFSAVAYEHVKDYAAAEQRIEEIEGVINPFWDYWNLKLKVYYGLNNKEKFTETLLDGKKLYAYTDRELKEILAENFPKFAGVLS